MAHFELEVNSLLVPREVVNKHEHDQKSYDYEANDFDDLFVPEVMTAGTFIRTAKVFRDFHHPDKAIVIDL